MSFSIKSSNLLKLLVLGFSILIFGPMWTAFYEDRPFIDPITYYLTWEETIYSQNFKEGNFKKVEPGMPKAEVEQLLGKPLLIRYRCNSNIVKIESYMTKNHRTSYDVTSNPNCVPDSYIWDYSVAGFRSNYYFAHEVYFDNQVNVTHIREQFQD